MNFTSLRVHLKANSTRVWHRTFMKMSTKQNKNHDQFLHACPHLIKMIDKRPSYTKPHNVMLALEIKTCCLRTTALLGASQGFLKSTKF